MCTSRTQSSLLVTVTIAAALGFDSELFVLDPHRNNGASFGFSQVMGIPRVLAKALVLVFTV